MDAARYLLAYQDEASGDLITNLKLQKLLYYAQGYHLALYGRPLFGDEIRAWQHGPVVKDVYHSYKDYDKRPIDVTDPAPSDLPDTAVEVLDLVSKAYGQFDAWKLREMTHAELPWKAANKHSGLIKTTTLETFFRAVLSRPMLRPPSLDSILLDPDARRSLDRALVGVAQGRRTKWQPST